MPADAPLPILFQDEHLLAVDKPPGRLVIPGRGANDGPALRQEIEARCGRIWVVHRLDRGTSGVVLFARTGAAHRALNMAFDRQQVEKRYLAIARDAPGALQDEWRATVPIAPARRGRMRPGRPGDPRAKAAATRFRVLERFPARAGFPALVLLEAIPESGRTHQIRVHLSHSGFPLAFDPDYGEAEPLRDATGAVLLERTPLHAARLALSHPATGRALVIESPLPEDMRRTLEAARSGRT